ncbi:MAG: OmpA family protein [Elusimicrobia bacterium]|nr:OmpA family protein [Elusimicrobiota bacterium]
MKRLLTAIVPLALCAGCVTTSTFKAQQKATADARALSVSLNSQLNASNERVTALSHEVAARASDIDGLKKEEAALQSRLDETRSKLSAAQDQVASLKKSVEDLHRALEANKSQLTRKVAELVKEKDAVAQRLASKEKAAAEAKAAAERQSADLTSANSDLQTRVADLSGQLAQVQRQKDDELAATKKNYEDMVSGLKAEIQNGQVTISNLKGRLTVNMVDQILFDSGSAEVKPAGRKVLDQVGAALNRVQDKEIRIEGHTDDVPISAELRGRYASNWELSTSRATSVARYLQDHAKVDPKRLVASGTGPFRPVAANDTPEHRALNRRIEIILAPME